MSGRRRKPEKRRTERAIETDIRIALGKACIPCWKHHVDNRQLHTGLGIGVADLICVVPPHGRFLALEVKRPDKLHTVTRVQQIWLGIIERSGGVACVVTTVEEALAAVDRAR